MPKQKKSNSSYSSTRIDELSRPKPIFKSKESKDTTSAMQNGDLSDIRLPPPPTQTYYIHKNGRPNVKSKQMKVFMRDYATLHDLFSGMTAAGVADYGTSKLFTVDGQQVRQMGELKDKEHYVAVVNDFEPAKYGQ
ncbi:unnamed protein product [Sphagnum balticum]